MRGPAARINRREIPLYATRPTKDVRKKKPGRSVPNDGLRFCGDTEHRRRSCGRIDTQPHYIVLLVDRNVNTS
jgi:hypothetical protein